jgi:hypothetical protein
MEIYETLAATSFALPTVLLNIALEKVVMGIEINPNAMIFNRTKYCMAIEEIVTQLKKVALSTGLVEK